MKYTTHINCALFKEPYYTSN